jgi:hypothetical protein
VVAVTSSGEAGRGAIVEAVARGLAVVLPDGSLEGVAGTLLAGHVTVPWARLVHEAVRRADSLASVRLSAAEGWNVLAAGPQLGGREDVVRRLEELRGLLRTGALSTDRPAPGAKVLAAEGRRVALPEVAPPSKPLKPPPLRKHPTRKDFEAWDGKAR